MRRLDTRFEKFNSTYTTTYVKRALRHPPALSLLQGLHPTVTPLLVQYRTIWLRYDWGRIKGYAPFETKNSVALRTCPNRSKIIDVKPDAKGHSRKGGPKSLHARGHNLDIPTTVNGPRYHGNFNKHVLFCLEFRKWKAKKKSPKSRTVIASKGRARDSRLSTSENTAENRRCLTGDFHPGRRNRHVKKRSP